MDRAFLDELRQVVGDDGLLQDPLELLTYECDALPHLRESPAAVVLPASASQVQGVVRLCARHGVPFVPLLRPPRHFFFFIAVPLLDNA